MANYVEIKGGKVLRVLVIDDSWSEEVAQSFLQKLSNNLWLKDEDSRIHVSKGHEFHRNREQVFFTYPKPHSSWKLDLKLKMYMPPWPKPLAISAGYVYVWSERLRSWILRKIGD